MPSKLREDMGEKFIVTKGLDGCLFGFSKNEWQNFEEKLKTLPLTNKNARDFVRFFLSGATECEIDKQGRFLIASNLREYASFEKDVVINDYDEMDKTFEDFVLGLFKNWNINENIHNFDFYIGEDLINKNSRKRFISWLISIKL